MTALGTGQPTMRIILDRSLFEPPWRSVELQALLHTGRSARHAFVCSPSYDPQADEPVNQWLNRIGGFDPGAKQTLDAILDQSLILASQQTPDVATLTVYDDASPTDWRQGRVTLPTALRLAQAPLHVLLEHRSNDRCFLLQLLPITQRERFLHAERSGWVHVEHGGGLGPMTSLLEDLVTAPDKDLSARFRRLRLWLMFDRDSQQGNRSAPSKDSRRLHKTVEDGNAVPQRDDPWPITAHQLGRRSIENYLPHTFLEHHWAHAVAGIRRTRRQDALNALAWLRSNRPEAAWQYNFKNGLCGDVDNAKPDLKRQRIYDHLNTRPPKTTSLEHFDAPTLAALLHDDDLDPLFRGLTDTHKGDLLVGFASDIADLYRRTLDADDQATRWDPAFADEYDQGPSHQPSRDAIASSLLNRI